MKKILFILLGLLIIIQFFGIDRSNPPVEPEMDFLYLNAPPVEIGLQIKAACYDCHSHETKYPWYTNIAPVSWWIKGHIDEGRENLNFSTWSNYAPDRRAHKVEEAMEEVKEGHMPLDSYIWMHPEADLTEADREAMAAWFAELYEQMKVGDGQLGLDED